MTFLTKIFLVIFLLLYASVVSAQQTGISTDEVYGSDPLLYNGKFYTFFLPLTTGGNQYFTNSKFETGSVTIRGVTYPDLMINYDIYNQQLLLQYKNNVGATSLIIISDAWLESFSYKSINFEIISTQDTLKRIYQVLGTGPSRILYYWKKDLNLDSFLGAKNFIFSVAMKEMNMSIGDKILKYWNNKSFYSLFNPEKRIAVKEYLRNNNVNVKKASDQTMTELINYCNSLSTK